MIDQYIEINKLLRGIREKSFDAFDKLQSGDSVSAATLKNYIQKDYEKMASLISESGLSIDSGNLKRHVFFGELHDYKDILLTDIPFIEEQLDKKFRDINSLGKNSFKKYLHPVIINSSYELFQNGNYREAVLNSIIAVFDNIRKKTGIDGDGRNLVEKAFSLNDPYLIFSNLDTESGKSDQKGFMQMYQGAFHGIRNPKSHSLEHDLTENKAVQYLIFASLLARRIDEAIVVKKD